MAAIRSIPWIPASSFILAILLSLMTGPANRAAGRAASSSTACNHTFTAIIPAPKCVESETNGLLDAPAACVDAAPAKGTKWYNEIGIDPQGVYIVSTVASAAANNGGLLGPTPQTQIDASKTLSGAMPCTPCHGTTCGAQAVATAVARLGHASLPFDFTVSNSISTVTVTRSIDCTGPSDSKTSFAYMIAIRFVFPALPPGERTTGFVLTGSPGHIKPGQLRPVGNNSDQFACTSTASLDLALGSIAQNANVTFQGRAQILGLKAAITNNPLDADSGAQAAGRLGSMTLVDVLDGGN